MMQLGPLFEYFDRIAIIHLPERVDRFTSLSKELSAVGLDIGNSKVSLPAPEMPEQLNGFPSRGVYGNFLSHLAIIERAYADGIQSVLVLEDDAIFSNAFNSAQSNMAASLRNNRWDQVFIGHSIPGRLPSSRSGLVRFQGDFFWAHCYAVHQRIMPRMIEYLRSTVEREVGDPQGGKMYIDGAYNLFRSLNRDFICLLSYPRLSIQRGSSSNLNSLKWYDRSTALSASVTVARYLRDQAWRRGWINVSPKAHGDFNKVKSADPWP
jgi:glycosyl transferase family 25